MSAVMETIGARIESLEWRGVAASLDAQGFAELPAMLDPAECEQLARMYPDDSRFRRVTMRHGVSTVAAGRA